MGTRNIVAHEKIRGIESTIEAWKKDHDEAMAVFDIEDLIRECVGMKMFLTAWKKHVWRRFFDEKIQNVQETGRALLDALENASKVFPHVKEAIALAKQEGYEVENSSMLDEAEAALETLKLDHATRWPFVDASQITLAREEIKSGKFRSTEDILHELQSNHGGIG